MQLENIFITVNRYKRKRVEGMIKTMFRTLNYWQILKVNCSPAQLFILGIVVHILWYSVFYGIAFHFLRPILRPLVRTQNFAI